MDPSIDLKTNVNLDESNNIPYASLIGYLNYCAICIWPDITFATNRCVQFTSCPTTTYWEVTKWIIGYLLWTKNKGIMYKLKGEEWGEHMHNLMRFTDADFVGDTSDQKSTTGWLFMYNSSPISWALKKQSYVSWSLMEMELIAGLFTSAEAMWLVKLGNDFKHYFIPIAIFTDNQLFIVSVKNDINNARTMHIDIHYHYTHDWEPHWHPYKTIITM